ncbi:MAG: toll/interleukin-1 receptor domain-containing protein [Gemmatimonadota bacterium]|nr:toll/interleukin-1 receptor domain-containing protein [Gemmatimonadota bacterium]
MPDVPVAAPMIFISYRRDDSSGHVVRLYDALSAHFGRKRLFFDIDHIAPGQDFVRVLEDSLNRSSVMIVVMGKRWGGTGKVGSRRIDDPGDFVRLEVASGLKRPELKMIPALISGAKMLGPAALPEELRDLSRRNAIELSDTRWREDVERLIASLERDMAEAAPRRAAASDLVRKAREITHAPAPLGGSWIQWGMLAAAVLVVGFGVRALFGRSATAEKAPPAATISTRSAGMISGIPTDDPHAMPSHLTAAARSALASGKKWRSDAVLTQIVAAPDSTRDAAAFRVQFGFRSPTDGAGLAFTEGATGQPTSERLPAIPMSTIRALPDSFIDLPAAVDSARRSGMFGSLREGKLASITSRGTPRLAWRLKSASEGSHLYYIDAATGALITSPPPAPSTAPQSKLVNKVKRLFH